MARPNVQIRVVDESIVVPFPETQSPTNGAMVSIDGLWALGTTSEKDAGLYLVQGLNDWYGRLRVYAENRLIISGYTGGTLQGLVGEYAGSYVSATGATAAAAWRREWWAVHNFLQYGGNCVVGFTSSNYNTSSASLQGTFIPYDVVFMGTTADDAFAALTTLVTAKSLTDQAVIGVAGITQSNPLNAVKYAGTENQYYMSVFGNKVHLNAFGGGTENLEITNLTPDVAGCISRTDRDFRPWYSPAGRVRGRILNLLRLEKNPTPAEQDYLYDNGINPVVSFPGEGTVLFGDKTGEAATSTLSGVNVSRLFMYLRKVIAPVARTILFEINDDITRNRFRLAADSILRGVQSQRGILDYRIICDASNNPPELVQAKVFVADILVKPTLSINYVRITFTNKNLLDDLDPSR